MDVCLFGGKKRLNPLGTFWPFQPFISSLSYAGIESIICDIHESLNLMFELKPKEVLHNVDKMISQHTRYNF